MTAIKRPGPEFRENVDLAIKSWVAEMLRLNADEWGEDLPPDHTMVVGWVVGTQLLAYHDDGHPGDDMLPIVSEAMSSYAAVGVARVLTLELEDDVRGQNEDTAEDD